MTESSSFQFGRFRLDAAKSVLWQGKQLVTLTPKAVALLRVLVEHGGDVVSKRELMTRVWPDTAVEEGNLSVTVAALRKALDPQPDGRSHIQTVPRRGYRFDAPVRAGREPRRLALAVLPFTGMGPETPAHLGMAMADAVIGRLTAYETLVVRPTLAVSHYATAPKSPREAAGELGVDAVLTGTVQREGDQVRVSVQLVPRPAALAPWAASFDAGWTDLFQVGIGGPELARALGHAFAGGAGTGVRRTRGRGNEALPPATVRSRFRSDNLARVRVLWRSGGRGSALRRAQARLEGHLLPGCRALPPGRRGHRGSCEERAIECDPGCRRERGPSVRALFRDWDGRAQRRYSRRRRTGAGGSPGNLWRGLFMHCARPAAGAQAIARWPRSTRSSWRAVNASFTSSPARTSASWRWRAGRSRASRHLLAHRCLGWPACASAEERRPQRPGASGRADGAGPGHAGPVGLGAGVGDRRRARRRLSEWTARPHELLSPCHPAVLLALGEREQALERSRRGRTEHDAFVSFSP